MFKHHKTHREIFERMQLLEFELDEMDKRINALDRKLKKLEKPATKVKAKK